MSSTEYNVGLGEGKSSSRVLRPPGGASSNIFGAAEDIKPHARPKYDQQNSSNLNFCMNTVDPNVKVQQMDKVDEPASVVSAGPAEPAAPAQDSSASAASPPKSEANLPQYHHHRSTALW